MARSSGDHIAQNNSSQTMTESGSATSKPRAKLPLPCATVILPPGPCVSSFIPTASSQWANPAILSNSSRRKRAAPKASARAAVIRRLAHTPGDVLLIARCLLETLTKKPPVRPRAIRIKPLIGQVRSRPRILCPLVAMPLLLISRPVMAQAADKVVTPIELFEPEAGEGIRLAPSLKAYPSLEADATYDTNVYNTAALKTGDLIGSIRPRLALRTELARHEFSLTGGAEVRRYAETAAENSEQFELQGSALLQLAERTEVIADAGFRRGIEQRGTAGDQFVTDEPVSFNRKFAGLLVRREGGFLEVLAEGRIAATDYRPVQINGVRIDLSPRDATVKRARIRGSAPSSHYSRVFLEASINSVTYDVPAPVSRNSDGYAVLAGMLLRLTDLVNLEVGAGYIRQSFDNPAIRRVSAFNFHLKADWTPRPDWQIIASGGRAVDPSPRTDVPAIVRSDFTLEARKALGRRALVSAEVGFVDENYQGSGRKDQRFYAGAGVHYRLTDRVGLIARASWRKQDGNAFGRDYDGVAGTLGVRVRY